MDLLWLLAKRYYTEIPMPSEIANGKHKVDNRSSKQIMNDLVKGLGGE